VLDRFTAPAIVRNGHMDLLASNHLGRAMHAALYDAAAGGQLNFARFTLLDVDAAHDCAHDIRYHARPRSPRLLDRRHTRRDRERPPNDI
jgi:hypothetical protein